jgi:pseudouridine synthase
VTRVRLQKILAAGGIASRRRAEELLGAGRVTVNDRVARLGDSADPAADRIAVDGVPVRAERHAYWLLHKPRGVLSTRHDPRGRATVLDLLPPRAVEEQRLFPVGRLDLDSEGLLLLTNDGRVTHALLHPSLGTEREYRVEVRGRLSEAAAGQLARGLPLEDGMTAPARVAGLRYRVRRDTSELTLTLVEGRKRQIRRALAFLGHPVVRLVRRRMGPLRLGELAPGEARPLTPRERSLLRVHVESRQPPARTASPLGRKSRGGTGGRGRKPARRSPRQGPTNADESPPRDFASYLESPEKAVDSQAFSGLGWARSNGGSSDVVEAAARLRPAPRADARAGTRRLRAGHAARERCRRHHRGLPRRQHLHRQAREVHPVQGRQAGGAR